MACKGLGWICFSPSHTTRKPLQFLHLEWKFALFSNQLVESIFFWPYKEKWAITFKLLQHLLSSINNFEDQTLLSELVLQILWSCPFAWIKSYLNPADPKGNKYIWHQTWQSPSLRFWLITKQNKLPKQQPPKEKIYHRLWTLKHRKQQQEPQSQPLQWQLSREAEGRLLDHPESRAVSTVIMNLVFPQNTWKTWTNHNLLVSRS